MVLGGGGAVWNTRRGIGSHCKILNVSPTPAWGIEGPLASKCGGRPADGTTKNRAPSSRDFLWLHYRVPAGRKEGKAVAGTQLGLYGS